MSRMDSDVAARFWGMHFSPALLDAEICARVFLDLEHGRTAHCPVCEVDITDLRQARRYYELKKFTCRNCHRRITAKKGTVLENRSCTPAQYILLDVFLRIGLSDQVIAPMVKLSTESVRRWRLKFYV